MKGFKIVLRNSQESQVELQTPSAGLRPRPRDSPLAPAMEYRVSSAGWAAASGRRVRLVIRCSSSGHEIET